MKILATADLHIHDYMNYSTLDEMGVPSRLRLYETLAADLVEIASTNDVKAIVVAGDILHGAVTKPMVLNVVQSFFETLVKSGATVLVIPGQHDLDVKSSTTQHEMHTALSSVLPESVKFFPEPALVEVHNVLFYLEPWNPKGIDYEQMPEANVFVGHGIVENCADLYGYKFKGGFNTHRLYDKFRISIIGDVHNTQTFDSPNRESVVLIPGQPITTNHSSSEPAGVWIIDSNDPQDRQFFPIYPRNPEVYHRFLSVSTDDPSPVTPNTHFYVRKTAKKQLVTNDNKSVDHDLFAICIAELQKLKISDFPYVKSVLEKCYQSINITDSSIPKQQRLIDINIENYGSIESFFFDFSSHNGDILIIGDNGTGKTTFVDALYWVITGDTTKPLEVSLISNNVTQKPASVWLRLEVDGEQYRIFRSREGGHILNFSKFLNNETGCTSLTKSSVRETQDLIFKTIGLTANDILALLYYSTNSSSTFTDLGGSDQIDLLGKLACVDQLESLRSLVSDVDKKLHEKVVELATKRSVLLEQLTSLHNNLLSIKTDRTLTLTVDKVKEAFPSLKGTSLKELKTEIKEKISVLEEKLQDPHKLLAQQKNTIALETSINSLLNKQKALKDTEETLSNQILIIEDDNMCYACGRPFLDLDHIKPREDIRAKVRQCNQEYALTESLIKEKNNELELVKAHNDKINLEVKRAASISDLIKRFKDILISIVEESTDTSEVEYAVLSKQIETLSTQVKEVSTEEQLLAPKKADLTMVVKALARNGVIVNRLIDEATINLQETINSLVDSSLLRTSIIPGKSIGIQASFRGKCPVPLKGFSAGERRLVDTLTMIALNKLIAQKYNLVNGLLGVTIFDEILVYTDPQYSDAIFQALQSLPAPLRFFITQDVRMLSNFNQVIKVTLENSLSKYTFMQ